MRNKRNKYIQTLCGIKRRNMSTNRELYEKAISKFGKRFKAVFAIMPDEIIEKYLTYDYFNGIKKLNQEFKFMLDKSQD
jgi:hypothetical protein